LPTRLMSCFRSLGAVFKGALDRHRESRFGLVGYFDRKGLFKRLLYGGFEQFQFPLGAGTDIDGPGKFHFKKITRHRDQVQVKFLIGNVPDGEFYFIDDFFGALRQIQLIRVYDKWIS